MNSVALCETMRSEKLASSKLSLVHGTKPEFRNKELKKQLTSLKCPKRWLIAYLASEKNSGSFLMVTNKTTQLKLFPNNVTDVLIIINSFIFLVI